MNWERNKDEAFKPTVSNNESNKWKWSLVLMLWCLQSNSAFFSSFFQPTSYWCGPETTGKINLSFCIAEKSPGKVDGRFPSQTVLFYFHISVFFLKKKESKKQTKNETCQLPFIHTWRAHIHKGSQSSCYFAWHNTMSNLPAEQWVVKDIRAIRQERWRFYSTAASQKKVVRLCKM